MFYFFKGCHGFLNALAILVMAAGVVVGSVRENSFVVVGLTAFGTVVKGWNDFKKFSFKVDMCRFAYTTYEKTLIELKTYVRGLPLEEFDGFLIRMQTLEKSSLISHHPCSIVGYNNTLTNFITNPSTKP